jgi:hypothetical protein
MLHPLTSLLPLFPSLTQNRITRMPGGGSGILLLLLLLPAAAAARPDSISGGIGLSLPPRTKPSQMTMP